MVGQTVRKRPELRYAVNHKLKPKTKQAGHEMSEISKGESCKEILQLCEHLSDPFPNHFRAVSV